MRYSKKPLLLRQQWLFCCVFKGNKHIGATKVGQRYNL